MEETIVQHTVTRTMLPLGSLVANTGQVPGLPKNPRKWTKRDVGRLAESLTETPELFDARGLIVYPYEGKNVVVAGNMRFEAARTLGVEKVPCLMLDEGVSVEVLKAIAIKDNGVWGGWDEEALGGEWADVPLSDWGVGGIGGGSEGVDNTYTRKVLRPEYVPKEIEPVRIAELCDDTKTRELLAEIAEIEEELPTEVAEFLRAAAGRHRVFNFARIAEFYSQQEDERVKRLFERSALVIIDWEDAIAGGFVRMAEEMLEEYKVEFPEESKEEERDDEA